MMNLPKSLNKRSVYLERVKPFIGKGLIKVFSGQRRVGKSYLLFQIIQFLQESDPDVPIIYINKEDLEFSWIKNAQDLHGYVKNKKVSGKLNYVFVDEIQDIEGFGDALRSLLLDEELDIYCTGSNANMLSGDISGHLSGRYIEIIVYSLSYVEFLDFHTLEDNGDALEKYLKYGGLPYLKHLELKDAIVFEYLKSVYNTIVYRDVINRYAVRNPGFLEQLVLFLARNTGSLFSAKKISDFLKAQKINMAHNLVQAYTEYLTNAFLVHKVSRYDVIGKRLFEIGDKFYFENLGIRHGIWGYRLEDKGKILENVVYNHLLFKGYEVKIGTLGNEEIDFVCLSAGETAYFQVALSIHEPKTLEREIGNLQKIPDNYEKTVITLDKFEGNSVEGIKMMDLRSFLKS
ncbi:ATP-binding protein [Litoribacter alkaliphilus]|uniref:ATP-binding protein n=2 Tax=Litoribacter ruber TaxID=702568 RepID=A0AAP2CKI7_9BACT|nr:ATP-binding protein [Litoribacter alkaliphilus]